MIVHPELRALRGDDSPQRDDQQRLAAALHRWRERPGVVRVFGELDAFSQGGAIDDFPALARLFDGSDAARLFADAFIAAIGTAFGKARLAHVPFRFYYDDTSATLRIAKFGNTSLALSAIDGCALSRRPAPSTADFSACEKWEHFLAGSGSVLSTRCDDIERDQARLESETLIIRAGKVISHRAWERSVVPVAVDGRLVSLRLHRRLPTPAPTREFRLCDGQFVHQAAGNLAESRLDLMMSLAGRMRVAEAAPMLARIAVESHSTALRWQALRECLALDTATGFTALSRVAASPCDDLAHAAGALRSQLVETYPQLEELTLCQR